MTAPAQNAAPPASTPPRPPTKTFGCGSAIASSSLVTEWVKGKSVDEATLITNKEIAKELSLPPVKIHCSVLAEDAIKAAIADFKKKRAERQSVAKVTTT